MTRTSLATLLLLQATIMGLLAHSSLIRMTLPDDPPPAEWILEGKAPWQARDSQAEFVFRGRLWIMGGWFNSQSAPPRDVWSSDNGKDWKLVAKEAPGCTATYP